MQKTAKLVCILLLTISSAHSKYLLADSIQQEGNQNTTHGCQGKRSVLPDGTVEIRNADCSITRISKDDLLQTSDNQASTQTTRQPQSPNVTHLREMKPQAPLAGEDDPTMRAKYLKAMDGYFDYYTAGYAHRQRVFEWQLISSKIIFFLVALLVISGVYFAAVQFHVGIRRRGTELAHVPSIPGTTQQETAVAASDGLAVTTFSASSKGIEISSPILGVIILVISLAFFYLYLVYIYPITELF